MAIYDAPNATTGIDTILVDTASAVPAFIPAFLFFVFLTVFFGGAIRQKRRLGRYDLPLWAVIASISTFVISLLLTLKAGLIQLEVLSVVIVITVLSGLWLLKDIFK